ncbi:MAG: M56 family metallopeptidase [Betaproteobacteria bacterium]
MTYALHGATLALAWFVALNVVLSAGVAAIAVKLTRRAAETGRSRSARRWLALRLLPCAVSAAFVAGVFLPSYWRFEPRDLTEGFDITLTGLAALGGALLVLAAVRGAGAWLRVARRARLWMAASERLTIPGVSLPAYRVEVAQPVLALVGIFRPRLLVTRGLLDALTPEELAAAIAHEIGHCRARDNLKRLAMCAAPDLLGWTASARAIESAWAAAAEHRADHAASTSPRLRVALASALVKVARLTPILPSVGEPVSTLVGGGAIAHRIEALIEPAAPSVPARSGVAPRLAVAVAVAALLYAYAPLLVFVHGITETVIRLVP